MVRKFFSWLKRVCVGNAPNGRHLSDNDWEYLEELITLTVYGALDTYFVEKEKVHKERESEYLSRTRLIHDDAITTWDERPLDWDTIIKEIAATYEDIPVPEESKELTETEDIYKCSFCGEVGRNSRTCTPLGHMSASQYRKLTEE